MSDIKGTKDNDDGPSARFAPRDRMAEPSNSLPDELWMTVLDSSCTFGPDSFLDVMLNLIKNPNVTSSHLFRADIFYDSDNDHTNGLLAHLKAEYRPIYVELPGFEKDRTLVRQLVPRNPQLDRPLVQTCHFFSCQDGDRECNIVLYIPHVVRAEDIPFYHPAVSQLAFEHRWQTNPKEPSRSDYAKGSISISYRLFPSSALTTKLARTALRLLETVHKHGQGHLAGYEKRVHLDQMVPQKRYQDTYTRLKMKYGRQLSEQWVEVTDPGKHVFEDIGIAAFLVELWRECYDFDGPEDTDEEARIDIVKPKFPGFVDIGCGNGVLVYILLSEGYKGWGFDARERKTWRIFPEHVQQRLQRRLLIPEILESHQAKDEEEFKHSGMFNPGTFIISNHADELTAWTPLLAYLNQSSFIAIPCCSHDLSGARFRAPAESKHEKAAARLPQQEKSESTMGTRGGELKNAQAAETGSLKRNEAQKKMPSAYSTLCSYVSSLAAELGYEPEREVLRIPSTRNQCIVGRRRRPAVLHADAETMRVNVVELVERELKKSVGVVGSEWIAHAEKLAMKPGSGH